MKVVQLCCIKMTQLQDLRKQAKEKGLKGYLTMGVDDLKLLLAGKPVPKKLRKNQVSIGTQTDFEMCDECSLKRLVIQLSLKANVEKRKIAYQDGLEIDVKTGEVCGYEIDYSRY